MGHNYKHRDAAGCARCNNPEWYREPLETGLDPEDCGLCSDCCTQIDTEFEECFNIL